MSQCIAHGFLRDPRQMMYRAWRQGDFLAFHRKLKRACSPWWFSSSMRSNAFDRELVTSSRFTQIVDDPSRLRLAQQHHAAGQFARFCCRTLRFYRYRETDSSLLPVATKLRRSRPSRCRGIPVQCGSAPPAQCPCCLSRAACAAADVDGEEARTGRQEAGSRRHPNPPAPQQSHLGQCEGLQL